MRSIVARSLVAGALAAVAAGLAVIALVPAVSARSNVGAPVKATGATHTITVSGHGQVFATPDEATMTVGVESRGTTAQQALSDDSGKMNAVIAAVEAQGVPSSHVQTSNLSLWYDSERQTYVASHQVTVQMDSVDRVGAVLDASVGAGANNSWGVSFGLKDPSAAHSQALQAAVADARKRADSVASSLGVSISGVGSASEATYQVYPVATTAAPAAPGAAPTTPVQPGQLTITADLTVVYTFG